ncbi:uncharacterized protein LOC141651376 [Silene latifolia]|uniref:uncharacterized protein LOC141651376 n=1 Tax=Silene latifolia TaxID=37657 RepID=UPI003D784708
MSDSTNKWSLSRKIKRAIKKVNFFLKSSFKFDQWRFASILRCTPNNKRYTRHLSIGYSEETLTKEENDGNRLLSSLRSFNRVKSICLNDNDDVENVDEKADLFIQNFHRQLLMERQISLQLRYCNPNVSNNGPKYLT